MRSFKKVISLLSAAVFALTAVPFAASAEDREISVADIREIPAVTGNLNVSEPAFAEGMIDPALRETCGLGCIKPIEMPEGYLEEFISDYEYDGISASLSDTDLTVYAHIKYNCEYYGGDYDELEQAVDAVASQASSSWSDFRKALFIHDYLATNCQYSRGCARGETYDKIVHSAYSALCTEGGVTVCQGYAEAYWLIAKELGLDCRIICSDDLCHAWNMVKVNGSWYQVDVTWDDMILIDTALSYYYFLVSDATMKEDHINEKLDWFFSYEDDYSCPFESSTLCSSTAYEKSFWRTERVNAPLAINGTDFYAVCSGNNWAPGLYKVSSSGSGTATKLFSFDYYSWINNYGSAYSGLALTKGKTLIFNDEAHIYAYYINTGKGEVLVDISDQITYPESSYPVVDKVNGTNGEENYSMNLYSTCPVLYGVKHENESIIAVMSVVGVGPKYDNKYVQSFDTYNFNPLTISASNTSSGVKISWTADSAFTSYRVYRKLSTASGLGSLIATVGGSSYTDTTAANNTKYTYNVIGFNSSLCLKSNPSNSVTITVSKSSSLSAPTYLSKAATASGILIKWNPVTSATSYTVYRSSTYSGTKTKIKTTGYTSYCDSTAVPGKSYYYWVTAYNSNTGKTSAYSTQYYITMPATPFSPTFTDRYSTSNGAYLKWSSVVGATSYTVYRSSTYSGTKTKLKTTSYTSFTDTTAAAGKSYYYWVTAYNSKTGKGSAYSKQAYVTMPSSSILSAPTLLSKSVTASGVVIKWKPVANATSYNVYRSDTYSGTKTKIKTTGYTSYCDDSLSLTLGKSYYYWVTAYNSNTGKTSAYSTQYYVTLPATPFSPTFTERYFYSDRVCLRWSYVMGVTSFTVYRSDTYSGTKTKLCTTNSVRYYDHDVVPGKSYYYWVTAYSSDTGKSSAYSKQAYIEIPSAS